MILSILHSVSQVWLLAGLLLAFLGTLALAINVYTKQRNYSRQSKLIASLSAAKGSSGLTPTIDWTMRRWPIIIVALTGLSLIGNAFLIWRDWHPNPAAPVYEYHDVRFLKQLDPSGYSWWIERPDGALRIDFCHDYNVPALNTQPGEVLWKFRYKDLGCASIKDDDLGLWFYRDKYTRWTIPTDVHKDYKTAMREIKAHE